MLPRSSTGGSSWLARIRTRARPAAERRLAYLSRWSKPPQLTVGAFASVIAIGTLVLALPGSSADGHSAGFVTSLFTATSAVCVTGLIVVDTPVHWSLLGQWVILGLIQVGGFGIMSLATVLSLVVTRRLKLRTQIRASAEAKNVTLGEVRQLVGGILLVTVVFEAALWFVLTVRFLLAYDYSLPRALHMGLFHSVSAFNNAGFALYVDSLESFATDPWISVPIALAVIAGGIGFPVWVELWRHSRRRGEHHTWSLHLKITVGTTAVLLVLGFVAFTALEWANPDTMGRLTVPQKLLTGLFQAVMPRTAGFNTLPFDSVNTQTLFVTDMLMFVGGGSAGTAGGIKVTTFALLAFVIYANVRGEPSVHVAGRRLAGGVEQQAITVALLAIGLVFLATISLMSLTPFTLDQLLFETVSAFSTVGLSTGITADLPAAGQLIITVLMFVGRVGPITLASALALRRHVRRYDYPEERPIVG